MKNADKYEQLYHFLTAYFTQDVESDNEALAEYKSDSTAEQIEELKSNIIEFMEDTTIDLNEKAQNISDWSSYSCEPEKAIEWLQNILQLL